MTRLASVLTESDLPLSELWAACLDGELVPLSSTAFLLADLPATPIERALAVRPVLGARMLIERDSAAWVFGARDTAPRLHTIAMRHAQRMTVSRYAATVREVVLKPGDTTTVAGIEITTRLRTAVDIARSNDFSPCNDDMVLSRLLENIDLVACREYLERARNLPGKSLALRRITDALVASAARAISRR
ncbi:type IV toxin-antitoxin system AbiEi family antitoxin [Agreia sp. COWG]|uniref:type IV toxin-antitoxin system AbiEi family antitoxin n=1 Tax=Agreia sp. COWG TaxID=2773266 RepID=UPI0019284F7F|nr:type IV toxin-antitoxin system AbiEi family antitoxin [Agreia sp. COWG]